MSSLDELAPLKYLAQLDASYNKLCDVHEVCDIISNWYYFNAASFKGNPMSKVHRYRENIIGNSYQLSTCIINRLDRI